MILIMKNRFLEKMASDGEAGGDAASGLPGEETTIEEGSDFSDFLGEGDQPLVEETDKGADGEKLPDEEDKEELPTEGEKKPPLEESKEEETPPAEGAEKEEEKEEETPKALTAEEEEVQKAEFLNGLKDRYAINEKDSDTLITDPASVLPEIAANIHANIMADVLQAVQSYIPEAFSQMVQSNPQMLMNTMTEQQTQQTQRDGFYNSYPKLVGKEDVVASVATSIETNFPNLSLEEALSKTGQVAMTMLGLQQEVVGGDPIKEKSQQPFTPVSGGTQGTPQVKDKSAWAEFL